MKKYIVTQSFSLLEKILIIEGDEIYAEKIREMYSVYSQKPENALRLFPANCLMTTLKKLNKLAL